MSPPTTLNAETAEPAEHYLYAEQETAAASAFDVVA